MTALAFIGLFMVAMIATIWWRGREFGELARRGVDVSGTVERKFRPGAGGPGGRRHRVSFRYLGPDGQQYSRAATIASGKWGELAEGGPIPLVCLPEKPGVSAPAWLVESARQALAKKR